MRMTRHASLAEENRRLRWAMRLALGCLGEHYSVVNAAEILRTALGDDPQPARGVEP